MLQRNHQVYKSCAATSHGRSDLILLKAYARLGLKKYSYAVSGPAVMPSHLGDGVVMRAVPDVRGATTEI